MTRDEFVKLFNEFRDTLDHYKNDRYCSEQELWDEMQGKFLNWKFPQPSLQEEIINTLKNAAYACDVYGVPTRYIAVIEKTLKRLETDDLSKVPPQ